MMKKNIFIFAIAAFLMSPLSAQTAKQLFRAMPDSILPLLTANNRADCTDFMDSKMKAEVDNVFKEKTQMTDMTNDYIALRLSEASTWQMKLLPMNDSIKIICVINTVEGPVADSRIAFYSTSWVPYKTENYIKLPTIDDFFKVPETNDENDSVFTQYTNARHKCDMCLVKMDLSKEGNSLTATFTTPYYIDKTAIKEMKPFLCDVIKYTWGKQKFSKE